MEGFFPQMVAPFPLSTDRPDLRLSLNDKILLHAFPILLLFGLVPLILLFSFGIAVIPDPEPLKITPEIRMTKKSFVLPLVVLFVLSFFPVLLDQAEARRLGGGRSFGSRPNYQRSAPQPQRSAPGKNQANQPGQAAPGSPAPSPGGMLGGLVMGGLIGSLLFGGAFTGPRLVDIVVFGGLAFLLVRYLMSKRMATEALQGSSFETPLAGTPPEEEGNATGRSSAGQTVTSGKATIPPDFDQADFMKGAKAVYPRLQESWDRRDLEDIRQFTSPEVWEQVRRQAEADPRPSKTEIVLVNATLLDVKKRNDQTVASVFYDVLMRETPEQTDTSRIREVWHFSLDENKPGSFWVLEGIQQVEPQD